MFPLRDKHIVEVTIKHPFTIIEQNINRLPIFSLIFFYSQICIFRREFITSLENLILQFLKCPIKLLFIQTSSQFWQLFWSNLSFWVKIPLIHLIIQKIIHRILCNNLRWLICPMSPNIQGHSFWIRQISTWSSQKSIFMDNNRPFFFINFYILLNRWIQSNIWFCKQLI